ncbi:hypothetical protein A3770_15p74760 [Chloropicon primus]|uniref:Uncharacterized protein n=1 Tax=Chloropicon primus TaxID=1764295 RepID=A0A5B8MVX3_9CHLO|nr:hypothetical protein A3770_15p74760 [Chloropicon primus]|eukprot:QDZ24958.1 hypothetical protein A3770_15p74760 [Chloropicon primus]
MLKRCIAVFVPDGLDSGDQGGYEALDRVSGRGCSGLLAWRRGESLSVPGEVEQLAQVLGCSTSAQLDGFELRREYQGAKCRLITSSEAAHAALGSAFDRSELIDATSATASRVRRGAGGGKQRVLNDLVHLILKNHVDDSTLLVVLAGDDGETRIENGFGRARGDEDDAGKEGLPRFLPRQSFQYSGGELIDDLCDKARVLCVHYSPVNHVRRDAVETFSASEALSRGGNGVTLATHLLKGIMFSVSRAPKYGA